MNKTKTHRFRKVLDLFVIFLYVALFTVGGGVAMVPLLERILVGKKHYITEDEFSQVFSISQIVPGSLMIHMGTFCGYRIAGFWGALASCVAITIPPLVIITLIATFYAQFTEYPLVRKFMLGILAGVAGQVAGVVLRWFRKVKFDAFKIGVFVAALVLLFGFDLNPIYLVLLGGVAGVGFGLTRKKA